MTEELEFDYRLEGDYSLFYKFQTTFGAQETSYRAVIEVVFPMLKRSEREADNSPPHRNKVMNAWSYTCNQPIRPRGMVLD
jgi:hypothetical protein